MGPQMASKWSQNPIKNELGTKSTKHVENVLNLTLLDLQETRFQVEWLSKTTKTRGADKYLKISKNCIEMKPKSMKNRPGTQTKTMLENRAQKNEKILKDDPKMAPKK